VLGTLTLPPRLALRALDDLHTIASAMGTLAAVADDVRRVAQAAEAVPAAELRTLAEVAQTLPEVERRLTERISGLEDVAAEGLHALSDALKVARELSRHAGEVAKLAQELHGRGDEVLEMVRLLEATADRVAERGTEVAAALPAIREVSVSAERIAAAAEPL
jgi:methyl-accepting chemotaxis protein